MKQLLFLIVVCLSLIADEQRNTQLCLNSSANFGTTHFIVGYKDSTVPIKVESVIHEKKELKRTSHKKQGNIRGGANLVDKNRTTQSFFTTIHDLSDILLSLISQSQKSLYIAAFTLTDKRIADLIIEKHKHGLDVCVIVDAGNMKQMHSKVQSLVNNNIAVFIYSPPLNPLYKKNGLSEPLMHHKCIVIDNEMVVTGSANLTKAGQKNNIENINILRDKQAVEEHREEIKRLKQYCTECKPPLMV
jgi:phosphatidylserine/phosphatidylglycerophosphate/cardiolipin synthase-like enzyme